MHKTPIVSYLKRISTFIKNTNVPICIECSNFIEHKTNYPYDDAPNDIKYGKCKLFGKQNLVTGQIENEYASVCRISDNMCGESGKYFDDRNKEKS